MILTNLKGRKVGIAAERNAQAIAKLVEKSLGTPIIYSLQGKRVFDEETSKRDVSKLIDSKFDLLILTTKIGVEYLKRSAMEIGQLDSFMETLSHTSLAIRGGKALNWLKIHSLQASYVTEDGSMDSLLEYLAQKANGQGKKVFFQSFDLDDDAIVSKLVNLGYEVYLSKPYYYESPDENTVTNLRNAIVNNALDTVLFTSKKQVDNLLHTHHPDEKQALIESFNHHVLAVGVGKVTAEHLKKYGIKEVFFPENQRTGTMIVSLGDYLSERVQS